MNQTFKDLLSEFNAEKVEYLVVGSFVLGLYSQPRYTKDIDIWIGQDPANAERAYRALARFGAPVKDITSADLIDPTSLFQIGIEPNRIDILCNVLGLDFAEAWPKRQSWIVDGDIPANYLSLDDFIASKKASGRPRDLGDIDDVLKAQAARDKKIK